MRKCSFAVHLHGGIADPKEGSYLDPHFVYICDLDGNEISGCN
jgi:non-canonical (house-cleaning) NTP pyrophosphatase